MTGDNSSFPPCSHLTDDGGSFFLFDGTMKVECRTDDGEIWLDGTICNKC